MCATLRGDGAISALFGPKGAFTGGLKDRPGLLRTADGGVLSLKSLNLSWTNKPCSSVHWKKRPLFRSDRIARVTATFN